MGPILPAIESDLDASHVAVGLLDAGALVAVTSAASLPAGLLVPWMADRVGSRRSYLAGTAFLQALAAVGLVLLPGPGLLWAALAGVAIGALFPLTMTLPLDLARDAGEVAGAAGTVLGVGYCLSALSPVLLGSVRDVSDSFSTGFAALAALACLAVGLALLLSPARLRRVAGD